MEKNSHGRDVAVFVWLRKEKDDLLGFIGRMPRAKRYDCTALQEGKGFLIVKKGWGWYNIVGVCYDYENLEIL